MMLNIAKDRDAAGRVINCSAHEAEIAPIVELLHVVFPDRFVCFDIIEREVHAALWGIGAATQTMQ